MDPKYRNEEEAKNESVYLISLSLSFSSNHVKVVSMKTPMPMSDAALCKCMSAVLVLRHNGLFNGFGSI